MNLHTPVRGWPTATSYMSNRLKKKRQNAGYHWLGSTVYCSCEQGAQLNFDDLTPHMTLLFDTSPNVQTAVVITHLRFIECIHNRYITLFSLQYKSIKFGLFSDLSWQNHSKFGPSLFVRPQRFSDIFEQIWKRSFHAYALFMKREIMYSRIEIRKSQIRKLPYLRKVR